jgi:hypothetical protein
MDSFAQVSLV